MFGEISFAGKTGYNIKHDDVKQRILEDLQSYFRFKVLQKHFETFHDGIYEKLNRNPHLVSLRSNGNPYLLYLTKVNFVNQCVFIDKKIQQGYFFPRMILSRFRFDDALYEDGGTLLDGEMIKCRDSDTWIFLIGDMIGFKGQLLENTNLVKRLNLVYKILETDFLPGQFDVCRINVKKYFQYHEINDMVHDFMPKLPYTCRGMYFKPLFLKFKDVLYNFDDSLIIKVSRVKYKKISPFLTMSDVVELSTSPSSTSREEEVSCCVPGRRVFSVKKTCLPDVYELYDHELKAQHTACIPCLKTSKFMREVFESKNVNDRVDMYCEKSPKFIDKWIPVACCS